MEFIKSLFKGIGYGLAAAPIIYAAMFILNFGACFFTCGLYGCFESCGPDSMCFHECGGSIVWDPQVGRWVPSPAAGQNTCFPAIMWSWDAFGIGLAFTAIAGGVIGGVYGAAVDIKSLRDKIRYRSTSTERRARHVNSEAEEVIRVAIAGLAIAIIGLFFLPMVDVHIIAVGRVPLSDISLFSVATGGVSIPGQPIGLAYPALFGLLVPYVAMVIFVAANRRAAILVFSIAAIVGKLIFIYVFPTAVSRVLAQQNARMEIVGYSFWFWIMAIFTLALLVLSIVYFVKTKD